MSEQNVEKRYNFWTKFGQLSEVREVQFRKRCAQRLESLDLVNINTSTCCKSKRKFVPAKIGLDTAEGELREVFYYQRMWGVPTWQCQGARLICRIILNSYWYLRFSQLHCTNVTLCTFLIGFSRILVRTCNWLMRPFCTSLAN